MTEEVWSWWQEGSIHRADWPVNDVDLATDTHDPALLSSAASVLADIRGAKSIAKVSQKTEISNLSISATASHLDLVRLAIDDVLAAGRVVSQPTFIADEAVEGFKVEATPAT